MTAQPATNKRDLTLLWRVGMLAASIGSPAIYVYAAKSYIREETLALIAAQVSPLTDLPPRMKSIETLATERAVILKENQVHDATVDVAIAKLTNIAENQQRQIGDIVRQSERQQGILDTLARQRP